MIGSLIFGLVTLQRADNWPLTRAERTNYNETSHYEDVVAFMEALQANGAPLRISMIGSSTEGRPIPLGLISYPPVSGPLEARASGKPIVYIQGNIHAGEVEGKEAAQSFLRRLCREAVELQKGRRVSGSLVDKIIFLVNPIYNADGNEKWGPVERNRPEQDGPPIVGLRANGQNLDLNRDAIKVESPEMGAALDAIYTKWDPDVVMDLHTTDGTRHGYDLTYAPPTNPSTEPGIMKISRDRLIPDVRREFNLKYKMDLQDYGNAVRRRDSQRWETFGFEGRYVTNYVGLRNRIGILSEATTFIPFKDRVEVTEKFVTSTMDWVAGHAKEVRRASEQADRTAIAWSGTHPQVGVRFQMAKGRTEDVPIEKPPGKHEKRPDAYDRVRLDVFDRWESTKTAEYPAGYFLPASDTKLVRLLRRHGIEVEQLLGDWRGDVQVLNVTGVKVSGGSFQGHRLSTVDGAYSTVNRVMEKGAYFVSTAQPLGILAFNILEPESTDGAYAWGMIELPKVGEVASIRKVNVTPSVAKRTITP